MNTMRKKRQRVHVVGIKGVAMTALALYLSEQGAIVTGSDVPDPFPTDAALKSQPIEIFSGFDPERISALRPDAVYYTGAHNGVENPEVVRAMALGIPSLPHGKALGALMKDSRGIVVAGCHGKTTTSAMVATIWSVAGQDPSYAIGCGWIGGIGAPGHKGKSRWFIAEGDEYVTDPKHDPVPRFLWLDPEILVVTNIDYDHPDVYANLSQVQQAFAALAHKSQAVIVNHDDENSRLLADASAITYGFSPGAAYRITNIGVGAERMFFTLTERGMDVGEFTLKVPGNHNVVNAAAASAAARLAGISWEDIRKGLLAFTGTRRRFEKLGEIGSVTYYDDYAHHPAEIRATLAAARSWYPERNIIAVFQPHTYSRTKALLSAFAQSFADSDTVILTDIYASAREHETLGITGSMVAYECRKHHRDVRFASGKEAVEETLLRVATDHAVVIFMGAGDIYVWAREIVGARI